MRLMARALVALCLAACVTGGASATAAVGGKTIAKAPSIKLNATERGHLYDSAFYSGFSVAFWTASFAKGDRISIRTTASGTPPCQLLYMPGTDDVNVSATTPLLEPVSTTRDGSVDGQRWVATETGTYVLAMTNADIYLSGPHQCLDASAESPFAFRVTVAHRGSSAGSDTSSTKGDGDAGEGRSGGGGGSASTHVVEPGDSLWLIARRLVGEPAGIAQVAVRVGRLWRLNAALIGTGNPNLIYPGQQLRLR
jgi:nucleoid-associated protein YgaU